MVWHSGKTHSCELTTGTGTVRLGVPRPPVNRHLFWGFLQQVMVANLLFLRQETILWQHNSQKFKFGPLQLLVSPHS